MKATILHNPRCSKSRAALALLEEAGAEVRVIDYLGDPPSREELARLAARAGLSPRELLRSDAQVPDGADVLGAIAADPRLLERPLVETERGVCLCRPPERVRELL